MIFTVHFMTYSNIFTKYFQLIESEPAMIYDSVHVFARGLDAVSREGPELKIRWEIVILTMPMVLILLLTFNPIQA